MWERGLIGLESAWGVHAAGGSAQPVTSPVQLQHPMVKASVCWEHLVSQGVWFFEACSPGFYMQPMANPAQQQYPNGAEDRLKVCRVWRCLGCIVFMLEPSTAAAFAALVFNHNPPATQLHFTTTQTPVRGTAASCVLCCRCMKMHQAALWFSWSRNRSSTCNQATCDHTQLATRLTWIQCKRVCCVAGA
jgi:hypothetical protein